MKVYPEKPDRLYHQPLPSHRAALPRHARRLDPGSFHISCRAARIHLSERVWPDPRSVYQRFRDSRTSRPTWLASCRAATVLESLRLRRHRLGRARSRWCFTFLVFACLVVCRQLAQSAPYRPADALAYGLITAADGAVARCCPLCRTAAGEIRTDILFRVWRRAISSPASASGWRPWCGSRSPGSCCISAPLPAAQRGERIRPRTCRSRPGCWRLDACPDGRAGIQRRSAGSAPPTGGSATCPIRCTCSIRTSRSPCIPWPGVSATAWCSAASPWRCCFPTPPGG